MRVRSTTKSRTALSRSVLLPGVAPAIHREWRSAPGSYDEKLQGGYFGFTESTPSGTKEKGMNYEPF